MENKAITFIIVPLESKTKDSCASLNTEHYRNKTAILYQFLYEER